MQDKKLYTPEDLERWGIAQTFREAEAAHKKGHAISDEAMELILEADQTGDLPESLQNMLDIRYGRKAQKN